MSDHFLIYQGHTIDELSVSFYSRDMLEMSNQFFYTKDMLEMSNQFLLYQGHARDE